MQNQSREKRLGQLFDVLKRLSIEAEARMRLQIDIEYIGTVSQKRTKPQRTCHTDAAANCRSKDMVPAICQQVYDIAG